MYQPKAIVRDALKRALRTRQRVGKDPWIPICIYDLAHELGIEVRFLDIPSLEGMYVKNPGATIIVSSLRPPGRQAFTCAHELGHHEYGHEHRVDLASDGFAETGSDSEEESTVNSFAGYLLAPKVAVSKAFSARKWCVDDPTPSQVYTVAGLLGMGYESLISHMSFALGLLPNNRATALRKVTPKKVRQQVLGETSIGNLLIVDTAWEGRAADVQVDDTILAPSGCRIEGKSVRPAERSLASSLFQAISPGRSRLWLPDSRWSIFVRVSRRDYVGRAVYRHLEDPDYGQ